MADAKPRRKVTINQLKRKMREGEQIVQMAIYDYRSAVIADRLGIDILCVSDTGGMILFGHKSTVTVTFDEVMMMAKGIDRGSEYGLRMVDMPYWSFHISPEQAVENAGRFVHEANAEVMKCEGNKYHARNIEAINRAGIPVQGHIGITPMRMPQLGGFFAQGKTAVRAKELVDDAQSMVDAGCFSIMCEVTSQEVNEYLAQVLPVPVISLGAGLGAHGVHIITSDLMHLYEEHTPRHSKIYTDLIPIMEDVFIRYRDEVKAQIYPGPEHTVYMSDEEALKFAKEMKWDYKLAQLDAKASAAGKKKTRKKTSLPAKKSAAKKTARKKAKKK
ncbi:MAG: 3-methyl-2-oxobutanoate hydroxymethyltransferase [Gammaproteobacteria bacterium]|jgi:3-methyl-2-oxobutanoate hydroxymethyltransferase|uniref:3-methyl-2-oxobutanoate hydroxymethyltransferase n=1 Tax=marine metagenome TaxID=408172 RepID=A0A381R673_9ZZZZ|nr:3-methyl-2-oxobutanoate hydroxymethyltransferase [Gammaproteobacteria bacterium]MEC8870589.1 3-methyl-2-oxobutanoate hydroxymethyltransferase [Pseudomonadota bacterium]|tara:strand:- start:2475 stop:3467 length:993 start_codon:yes stop_codon:yes gene_type:complete